MKLWTLAALAAAAAPTAPIAAQPLVVPTAYSSTPGGVSPSDTLTREFARTHQQVIAASQLGPIPIGATITQITFRPSNFGMLNALGSWPASARSFGDYEIYLARAARAPGSMSPTLADNIVPESELRVRDGPLAIPPGIFSNFTAPPNANPWGLDIQLSPYTYTGGDLVITIRHSGHLTPQTPRLFVDSLANPLPNTMQCMAAGGIAATTGSPDQSLPVILRMRFITPSPCPANCDGSSIAPALTANDFLCFLNNFTAAAQMPPSLQITSYANCDHSTTSPILNIGDFVCFNSRFAAGCP